MSSPVIGQLVRKHWGTTRCLHFSETCEVWHASIVAGGFSSFHVHRHKDNAFYLLRGHLELHTRREWAAPDFVMVDLLPLTMPANSWHRFYVTEPTELLEIYNSADGSPVDPNDIVRMDNGGIR